MSDRDDKSVLQDLEAELRQDRLEDPGDAFFADLQQQVMRQVKHKPAPGRPWWHRSAWGRWLWRPAPVAALAGAAAVALVVLWVGGPGGPEEISPGSPPTPGRSVSSARPPAAAVSGEAWFDQLPPTGDLWALEDRDLPALYALLSDAEPDDDDALGPPPSEPVGEEALDGLTEAQLRALERLLDKQPAKKKKTARPRPAMGQAG